MANPIGIGPSTIYNQSGIMGNGLVANIYVKEQDYFDSFDLAKIQQKFGIASATRIIAESSEPSQSPSQSPIQDGEGNNSQSPTQVLISVNDSHTLILEGNVTYVNNVNVANNDVQDSLNVSLAALHYLIGKKYAQ